MTEAKNSAETQALSIDHCVSSELIRLIRLIRVLRPLFGIVRTGSLALQVMGSITCGNGQMGARISEKDWSTIRDSIVLALKVPEAFGSPRIKYIVCERHPDVPHARMMLPLRKPWLTDEEFKVVMVTLTGLMGMSEEFAKRFFFEVAHVIGEY